VKSQGITREKDDKVRYNKNNESINKYLAGLFDGDGTIYCRLSNNRLRLTMEVVFNLDKPKVEDTMYMLYDHYGLGRIDRKQSKNVTLGYWVIEGKRAISLFNRIKKYLVIKATHGERIIKLFLSKRDVKHSVLKRYLRLSRRNTTSLKYKSHINWAWLAGYIDADGYIGYNPKIYTGIRFGCNADKDNSAIELISRSFGRPYRYYNSDNCNRLDIYMSKDSKATAQRILPKLLPHLRFKKWEAEQLLHYVKTPKSTRRD